MSAIDLKEYTTKAVELESAIYTQRKLMEEHREKIQEQRPAAPKEEILQEPVKPSKSDYIVQSTSFPLLTICSLIAVIVAIIMIFAVYAKIESGDLEISDIISCVFGVILGIFGALYLFAAISTSRDEEKLQNQKDELYDFALTKYDEQLAAHKEAVRNAHVQHLKDMEEFSLQDKNYTEKADAIFDKHSSVLKSLECALQELYSQDVIFPKYREMVAITTINEYLISGRCYELEGPDGAYNLYEMELRQNVIIGQLSSIVSSLEQIKSNQFSLYQELVKANQTISEILEEVEGVSENTRLAAYYSGVTALIESSPKVYFTHTI